MDESDQSGTLKLQFIEAGLKFTQIQFAVNGKWEKAESRRQNTQTPVEEKFPDMKIWIMISIKKQEMNFNTMRS